MKWVARTTKIGNLFKDPAQGGAFDVPLFIWEIKLRKEEWNGSVWSVCRGRQAGSMRWRSNRSLLFIFVSSPPSTISSVPGILHENTS